MGRVILCLNFLEMFAFFQETVDSFKPHTLEATQETTIEMGWTKIMFVIIISFWMSMSFLYFKVES